MEKRKYGDALEGVAQEIGDVEGEMLPMCAMRL